MRWMRRNARRPIESLYEDHPSVGSDTETSGPPNSEGRAAGSEGGRERLTRSRSRPTERNRSTVRFQEGSILPYSSQELVSVQQEEALIDLNPEMDVDPIPSESEPSIAQQIDMISEPETPAPVTPAPRGRTLSKRRPRSVTSEITRQSARHHVAQEAVCLAMTALPKLLEAPLIPAPTPSGHSTTIVLAEDNTSARSKHTTHSRDIQELDLTDADGKRLRVFNIYNRPAEVGTGTLGQVLGSQDLTPRFVACEVTEKIHVDSDYLPIRTLIDIQIKTPEAQRRRN
ncbi:uncharacterized protein KD926_000850 [Aspergillus affinis]|uniref:uncharacterized protein n=1 Tax=Aspergillus affinis TaxID=1070780 RepID=UPI0022FE2758|nr:uncharacterized protein KD926_000850 [Aspergillus affinis]KAI9037064.1 hypothetical protein KD926_000850 [Aspergillus affinis]